MRDCERQANLSVEFTRHAKKPECDSYSSSSTGGSPESAKRKFLGCPGIGARTAFESYFQATATAQGTGSNKDGAADCRLMTL